MNAVTCLSCGAKIELGMRPRLFQEVICKNCKQRFLVIEIDPPEIYYPLPDRYDEEPLYPLEDH